MNNVKKVVVMDFKYLLRYKEFLLNNQNHNTQNSNKQQQLKQQQLKQQQQQLPQQQLKQQQQQLKQQQQQLPQQPYPRANFCTFCCDDCDGSCMNGRYTSRTLVNNINNINNINNVNNINKIKNLNVSVMLCSKLCDDNVYNDCICL